MNVNLTQVKKRLPVIIPALTIFILLIIVAFVYVFFSPRQREQKKPPSPTAQPTPTPQKFLPPKIEPEKLPQDVQAIRKKIIVSHIENRRGDLVLYQPGPYEITYIPTPKIFFVNIFKDPAEIYKKQAQAWFLQFGLKQIDLCDLPVRFVLGSKELQKSNPNFKYLPDGC